MARLARRSGPFVAIAGWRSMPLVGGAYAAGTIVSCSQDRDYWWLATSCPRSRGLHPAAAARFSGIRAGAWSPTR
jgi:hypothetical protein